MGDGTPTFSYAPIQSSYRTSTNGAWSNWTVMEDKIAEDNDVLFRNFEEFSGNTSNAGFTHPVTYASDFNRPEDEVNVHYRYGEVKKEIIKRLTGLVMVLLITIRMAVLLRKKSHLRSTQLLIIIG